MGIVNADFAAARLTNSKRFAENYPNAKIIAPKMAFMKMKIYFGTHFAEKQIVVAE